MIPRANILALSSAPPENTLNNASSVPLCWSIRPDSTELSMPGTGINEPARNITMTINTKNKRWRNSVNPPPDEVGAAAFAILRVFAIMLLPCRLLLQLLL